MIALLEWGNHDKHQQAGQEVGYLIIDENSESKLDLFGSLTTWA
jgi:hypothetical protein